MKTVRLFLKLIRYTPGLFLASIGAYLIFFLMPLLMAVLTGKLFDALSGNAVAGMNAWTILALIGGTEMGRILCQLGAVKWWATFEGFTEGLLRSNMLRGLLYGRPSESPLGPGEAVSRFGADVEKVLETLETWVDGGGTVVYILATLSVMAGIHWQLSLVMIALGAVIILISRLMYTRVERVYAASRQTAEQVTGFLGEILGGVQSVKVARAEANTGARFQALVDLRRQAELRSAIMKVLIDSFVHANVAHLATGILLILSAYAMQDGTLSVGDFSVFTLSIARLTDRLRFIGRMMVEHQQAGISFGRMAEMLPGGDVETLVEHRPVYMYGELPAAGVPEEGAPLAALQVEGLTYRFPDGGVGLDRVDLTVEAGGLTVITGRVGSGKSLLIRALLGLVPATEGKVRWNGEQVDDPGAFFVPPRSAYTPQVPRLFSGTIRENILMGHPGAEAHIEGAVAAAALEPDLAVMAQGQETVIGPKGARLSGGQVQRVAAARALVRRPQLLVVDDLSSALDVETERAMWDRLLADPGTTCLAVSHRRAVLRRAKRIVVMNERRVEAVGTLEELLQSSPEMQKLWLAEESAS